MSDRNNSNQSDDDLIALPSYIDLLQIVWRRKSLLLLGIVIGVVAGSLYYSRAVPIYESSAEVLVVKKRPEVVTGDQRSMSSFEDYVATHRALIKSPLIIEQAIAQGKLGQLKTFRETEVLTEHDLSDRIIRRLTIGRGSRDLGEGADSILTLAFRGNVAGRGARTAP
jgi:uncharacterized protein involved in exopolysaccharide biosynthesis